ncbi:MAG: hypothetical protein U9R38_06285 [Candidatus Margulisiibacteriota bacterium]|nr:hypothetical protein [Candidatus Margulisiibacteriota bacterium]
MIYLKLIIGLFVAWLLGYLIVYLFDPAKKLPLFEGAALSFLVGQGAITLLLFFLFLLLVPNPMMIATLLIAIMFAVKLFIDKKKHFINFTGIANGIRRSFANKKNIMVVMIFVVLFSLLTVKISYLFVEACSKPEYAWDASGNWTVIGQRVYYAQEYRPDKVVDELQKHVSGYPRGLSLTHYWLFSWMGEANDQWSKIIFPLNLICLLIIFYYGLKPIRGRLGALAFTYFLASVPLLMYHATIGYADLTKTVYFAAGIIYFYRWLQTKQNSYFWFFAVTMALTTWIKMEGKVLYAIGFALLLYYLWQGCKEPLKNKLLYIGKYLSLYLIIGLPWQLFIMFGDLPYVQSSIHLSVSQFLAFHEKIYALMFMDGSWGIFWVIAAAAMLFFFRKQLIGANLYLLLAIILFYGNLLFIYSCFHDTVHFMQLTFSRVLLPIYPVAVFNMGCILPILKIDQKVQI